ncbi:hypothetical protein Q31b_24950 [Novipirellula aureliae]|uniref:Uncharacterized protein n=1 Tax=Novipirellula aureliae TaxID=2527966 RepID=A0A5C6E4N1_9BACT|nr:hypothetical protein Q31b_24950 [Novipirellula aureliae]
MLRSVARSYVGVDGNQSSQARSLCHVSSPADARASMETNHHRLEAYATFRRLLMRGRRWKRIAGMNLFYATKTRRVAK